MSSHVTSMGQLVINVWRCYTCKRWLLRMVTAWEHRQKGHDVTGMTTTLDYEKGR